MWIFATKLAIAETTSPGFKIGLQKPTSDDPSFIMSAWSQPSGLKGPVLDEGFITFAFASFFSPRSSHLAKNTVK